MSKRKELVKKRRVLLIDDENHLRQILSILLETRGFEVLSAPNGKAALELLSHDIDVVILDLVLPDMDGFEICRHIRSQSSIRHIPIIMLSAYSLVEDRIDGLYLGVDDFLSKPCEYDELIARIEAVMRRCVEGPEDHGRYLYREGLIRELRRILNESLLVPHYQPIYHLQNMELYGVEILTRPESLSELSDPAFLFKTALQYGMYVELEMLSWSLALKHLSRQHANEKIFLNCNPYFIESSKFLEIQTLFGKYGIAPGDVVMEITERSAISDFKYFYNQLRRYRDRGYRFAVDDVGGGYASLESIVETQPEIVKIDGHIVQNLDKDPFKQSIVRFVVAFCHENNILSIAEGIETASELEVLKDLGVDAGQGFFLYRPSPNIDIRRAMSCRP